MPELPEVETVRRGLEPAMAGQTFEKVEQRRADLRFPFPADFAARLTGRRIEAITRRAKYLFADLDDGETLIMHLGMSGSFRVDADTPGVFHHDRSRIAAHDHVVFHMSGGATVTYNDPRRFGFMLLEPRATLAEHKLFRDMEKALAAGPWLCGDAFTLADIGFISFFSRMEAMESAGIWRAHYPRVADWYERCKARPSFGIAITNYIPAARAASTASCCNTRGAAC